MKFKHRAFEKMSSTQESTAPDSEDCFKILLATDIHLGYKEKDEIIGKYSDSTHFVYNKRVNCCWNHKLDFFPVFDSCIGFNFKRIKLILDKYIEFFQAKTVSLHSAKFYSMPKGKRWILFCLVAIYFTIQIHRKNLCKSMSFDEHHDHEQLNFIYTKNFATTFSDAWNF